jgi:hypothetical protein
MEQKYLTFDFALMNKIEVQEIYFRQSIAHRDIKLWNCGESSR